MKKRIALLAALLLTLAGCSGDITTGDGTSSTMSDEVYTLNDGRQVTCIYGRARLSCDWENAK